MSTLTKTNLLVIGSSAFEQHGEIPSKHTCQGENINPPISVEQIPAGTKSLVCIVEDPDAAGGTFNHWIIWNIRPSGMIAENSAPGIQGENGFGTNSYKGPCPPIGTHRYFFKVFALDILLNLPEGADKKTLEKEMQEHILARGELIGEFRKTKETI